MRLSQLEDHLRRQIGILRNAGACMLLTMPEGQRLAGLLRAQVETLTAVESVTGVDASAAPVELPQVKDPDSVALIQYTSCAYRKSNPGILMVQSAQDRTADNASNCFGGAPARRILVQ
jgi:hypothetical protein